MKEIFLLDLDGTLLDFSAAERENLLATLRAFSLPASEEILRRFHAVNDALWQALERGELSRERLKVLRFETLFAEEGIEADARAVSERYLAGFEGICYPYRGAAEFLKELSARGRAYLVTNGGTAIQRSHIRLAGFGPYFAGTFISEEMGCDKPSKAFADRVASQIPAFRRERAVWLGDSLTSDMVCAKVLGVDFILFAPSGAPTGYRGDVARNYEEAMQLIGR